MDQAIFVHIVAPYLIKSRAKSGYRNTIFRPTFEVRDFDNHHHNRHLTLPTTTPQLRCPLRQHSFSELDVLGLTELIEILVAPLDLIEAHIWRYHS